MSFEETFKQLLENFPVLDKIKEDVWFISHENELILCTKSKNHIVNQQDCLELSQLFALLATAFEEV